MLFIAQSPVSVLVFSIALCISQIGESPLIVAAYSGHTKVVTQLLVAEANTDLQDQVHNIIYIHTYIYIYIYILKTDTTVGRF